MLEEIKNMINNRAHYKIEMEESSFTIIVISPMDLWTEIPITYLEAEGFGYVDIKRLNRDGFRNEYGIVIEEIEIILDVLNWMEKRSVLIEDNIKMRRLHD